MAQQQRGEAEREQCHERDAANYTADDWAKRSRGAGGGGSGVVYASGGAGGGAGGGEGGGDGGGDAASAGCYSDSAGGGAGSSGR